MSCALLRCHLTSTLEESQQFRVDLVLSVEHMPCGAPGITLSVAPFTSLAESRAGPLDVKPLRRQNAKPDKNQEQQAPIPTRLINTCTSVYVDVVVPSIMTSRLFRE